MFRNQYDNDVTVWSPQGRLHQVEYAMEAVKQGSATVGLKNSTHAILVALKRASSELSAHQKKIIVIDDHCGIAIAGLTADARLLSKYMRTECLTNRFTRDAPLPINRLVSRMGNKMQSCTQRYDRRPYGVGLLVAGYDDLGPHIYQTCPSANYFDCKAMAIGARSQSARTYLEKYLDTFKTCNLEELVKHGLRALRECLPNEVELNTKNASLAIVGEDMSFTLFEDERIEPYLKAIEGDERPRRGGGAAASGDSSAPSDKPDDKGPSKKPEPEVAVETMAVD
ncbi:unnamed protein product [Larinioides sclopetarius]|uniref:Proteasome subunit alpha type n=2 Tax=Larinioides sclopetarius TaxID=280406 RepID=A0AAV2BG65_9ARAC